MEEGKGEGWVLEKEFGRSGRVGELLPVVEEEEGKVKEERRGEEEDWVLFIARASEGT